jgi:hypothetical protein
MTNVIQALAILALSTGAIAQTPGDVPVGKGTIVKGAIICADMFSIVEVYKFFRAGDVDGGLAHAKTKPCGELKQDMPVTVLESNFSFHYAEIALDGKIVYTHPMYIDPPKSN